MRQPHYTPVHEVEYHDPEHYSSDYDHEEHYPDYEHSSHSDAEDYYRHVDHEDEPSHSLHLQPVPIHLTEHPADAAKAHHKVLDFDPHEGARHVSDLLGMHIKHPEEL